MTTLWDHAAAVAARDEAVLKVQAYSVIWRTIAYDVLVELAHTRTRLTSDDLWEELTLRNVRRPDEGRAAGPVMQKAVREKVLTPDGFTQGRNPKHHLDIARRYRSLVVR